MPRNPAKDRVTIIEIAAAAGVSKPSSDCAVAGSNPDATLPWSASTMRRKRPMPIRH